ncbi:MAG: DUF1501 domain-containing protein [Pirellulaceae bacterium]|nr:DUF1501 domain-containing protein [Pirellulaceae bacterium]
MSRNGGISRRHLLQQASLGFGGLALASLLPSSARGFAANHVSQDVTHRMARAKHVIFLYMDGGVSHVDSFDPKPRLTQDNGKPFSMQMEPTQFEENGSVLGSPWQFQPYGESQLMVSDLFPNVGRCADDLCVIRSMVSKFSEHNAANYFLHSGHGQAGRPSIGAWGTYGLGSENSNLPGYVVLDGGLIPSGGVDCFGAGFLPATYQASMLQNRLPSLANIEMRESSPALQRLKLETLRRLDAKTLSEWGPHDPLEAAISNYELAYKMQMAVPAVTDISSETAETQRQYGLESPFEHTRSYGRQCLVARRLIEQGVRFVELTCPKAHGSQRWDAHGDLKNNHTLNAQAIDQPIAALIQDLKQRGLLNETLLWWSGEFGRTPFAQGSNGRDHNPFGFTCWLAGGGIRGGTTWGATDEYGYKAVENRVEIHDLHATILHLLGLDHEKLTYRFGGRDYRLTDVHGKVLQELIR